jgi:excisionase family DNA binding protein
MAEKLLTLKQAAERLNVHPTTVRRWADDGSLASIRTPGGHRRFSLSEVERVANGGGERDASASKLGVHIGQHALVTTRADLHQSKPPVWLKGMDEASREEKRLLGRRLLGLLMQYVAAEDGDGEEVLAEARVVGRIYAKSIVQSGMSLPDAMKAVMFFRDHILESAVMLPDSAHSRPEANKRVFRRVNDFLNAIQLVVAEAYGAQESARRDDYPKGRLRS